MQCLCVVMGLLGRISKGAGHSLMDASNLAIVMAPNLLETSVPPFQLCDNSLPTQTSKLHSMNRYRAPFIVGFAP